MLMTMNYHLVSTCLALTWLLSAPISDTICYDCPGLVMMSLPEQFKLEDSIHTLVRCARMVVEAGIDYR